MTRLNETEIINLFSSSLKIRELDDVSLVNIDGKSKIAFKCDMLVASTDVPPQMTLQQAARKSIVSCVSDLASKGIRPLAALISLGLPQGSNSKYVGALASGFRIASKEFNVKIVGGDTNSAKELIIDCSMIGTTQREIPTRRAARPGDIVAISGPFGYSPSGLNILMHGCKADKQFRRRAIDAVVNPKPAGKFGYALSKYFNASMDSSDGLAISLYTISTESKVDMVLTEIPAAPGLQQFASRNNLNLEDLVFYGGEEYEIVSTFSPAQYARATRLANRLGLKCLAIGKVTNGSGKVFYGGKLLEKKGYDHFQK